MRIQHNITAMNAYRNYNNNTSAISKNLEKLSSGYKINRAGDDAAGLAVSQKMRLQIAGLAQAQKNAKSGISYIQTAEGALQEVHEMLERMYTLAEQSANGTFDDDTDRTQLQKEVNSLMEEINRIGKTANFNGMGIFKQYVKPAAPGAGDDGAPTLIDETGKAPAVKFNAAKNDATQTNASFSVNLAGAAVANGEKYKLTVGGATFTSAANTGGTGASDLATSFNGAKATIGGVEYTISVDGTTNTKLIFTGNKEAATAVSGTFTVAEDTGGTAPTSDPTSDAVADAVAGNAASTAAKGSVEVDFNGLTGADVIGDTVKVGDKTYEFVKTGGTAKTGNVAVTVADDTTANDLATKFAAAAKDTNVDAKLDNGAASGTKVTFTAKATGTANMIAAADAKATDAGGDTPPATKPTKYESTITGGDENALATGDTIKIGSKTYTLAADNNGDNISVGANDTFEKQIKAAIEKYNAETSEDFTAAYANGKVTFTPKTGKTPTAAPTFTITDQAGNITNTAPTAAKDGDGEAKPITFWVGAEYSEDNKLTLQVMSLEVGNIEIEAAERDADSVGQDVDSKVKAGNIKDVDITTAEAAMQQLSVIKQASDSVSNMRGTLGAMQNRLDHTLKNLSVMQENMQDAESVIRDTDVAEEMMAYTKNSILVQSAQAMLAQANQLPQGVLQLLQ